uniref:Uncharacterized protein n=1 Tax=Ditylenchus dipsaci TaxID=166011 RepID=A0A915DCC8_9BILA
MISYSVLAILVCTWAVPFVVYFLPHYLFTSPFAFLWDLLKSFVLVSMISYLPEFNRAVLGLQLSSNGKWSALPFAIQVFSKILFAFLADWMKSKNQCQFGHQIFNSIASFGCAICMLIVSITSDSMIMLTFLCIGLTLTSAMWLAIIQAPAYTAAVSAYGQVFSQLASISAPIIIVDEEVDNCKSDSSHPSRVQRISIMDENGDVYMAGAEQQLKEPF